MQLKCPTAKKKKERKKSFKYDIQKKGTKKTTNRVSKKGRKEEIGIHKRKEPRGRLQVTERKRSGRERVVGHYR